MTLLIVFCCFLLQTAAELKDHVAFSRVNKSGDITIGALLPIHASGEDQACGKLHSFGLGFAEALIYTVNVINNRSDILPGVTLGYDIRDYCESPTLAMKWTHEFVKNNYMLNFDYGACVNNYSVHSLVSAKRNASSLESPIVAVIGAYDSGTTVLIAELLQVVLVPLISPFSTSEQLSLSYYSAFFRTIPPDGLQAKAMADIIELFDWDYVAVVAVDHSYGRFGVRFLEKEAEERNNSFCTGIIEYFPRSGFHDKMESIVQKLLKRNLVRVIVLWANSVQSLAFLKKAMELGLRDKIWILSDDFATTSRDNYFKGFADEISGVFLGVAHRYHSDSSLMGYIQSLPAQGKRHEWWNEFVQEEFNCTMPGVKSRLASCSQKDLHLSKTALHNLINPFTPYMIDAVETVAHALDKMYKCNSSNRTCPKTRPFIDSKDLVQYIKGTDLEGVTGRVMFDKHGNPKFSSYDIVNIGNHSQEKFVKSKIGTWSINKGLRINSTSITWSVLEKRPPLSVCTQSCAPGTWQDTRMKNCCWECIPCADGMVSTQHAANVCTKCEAILFSNRERTACIEEIVINVKISSSVGIIFTILAGIGIVFVLLSMMLFVNFYNTPLVKASNRELSFALLVIISLGFVFAILHVDTPTHTTCTLTQPWRYSLHCLCISILFIKTIRIARAFQLEITGLPKWCKRFVVNPKLQVITLIVLNTCPVVLALLWGVLDGPYVVKKRNELQHEIEVEYICKPYHGRVGHGLELSSLCYLILLTMVCIFYSFKARNLPGNFNETRYIGLSLYILLLSWLAYYPINSLLMGWYVAIISSATALLGSYGLLGCIFMPKIFIILVHPEMNTNEFVRAELRFANTGTNVNSISAQSQ